MPETEQLVRKEGACLEQAAEPMRFNAGPEENAAGLSVSNAELPAGPEVVRSHLSLLESPEQIAAGQRPTEDETGEEAIDPYARWTELVLRVQSNDPAGLEELYRIFAKGVRYYLQRQLGQQELDDKVHDTFLIVVQAIQRGELREPQRLMGFVRTVVRRRVAMHIDQASQVRRERVELEDNSAAPAGKVSPEDRTLRQQRAAIMLEILEEISPRDREILTRFYIYEEPAEEICEAMGLSETQFRLLKSRAKSRFGEIGRRRLASRPLTKMAKAMLQ